MGGRLQRGSRVGGWGSTPLFPNGEEIQRPVYLIIEDDEGRIWFGTDRGVYIYDGEQVHSYTIRDGLVGNEANRAAGLVDHRGKVWIGTDRGATCFRPQWERHHIVPPLLTSEGVLVGKQQHPIDQPLALANDANDLIFRFHAISFIDEKRVTYRYRLHGYDRDWLSGNHADRASRYTNLPPGEYVFAVQAANAAGVWSRLHESAPIRINPPIWNTIWARILFASLFLILVLGYRHIQSRKYRAELAMKKRLEEEVAGRTRDIREKNRELETIDTIVRAVNEQIHLAGVLQTLLDQCLHLFPHAERGLVLFREREDRRFRVAASHHYQAEEMSRVALEEYELQERITTFASQVGRDFYLATNPVLPLLGSPPDLPVPKSSLVLVISLDDKPRCFLALDQFEGTRLFDRDDIARLERFREHAIAAVAKADALQSMKEKSDKLLTAQRQLITQEKMSTLGILTAGIAHEIRNPLNFINNFAGIHTRMIGELHRRLENELPPGDMRKELMEDLHDLHEGADSIVLHGTRVSRIIDSLVQLSKLTKADPEVSDTDINHLLETYLITVAQTTEKKFSFRDYEIEMLLDPSLPRMRIIPGDLGFVFTQLITNALDALAERMAVEPEHRAVLRCSTHRRPLSLQINIADNGLGICPENMAKIFTPFFTTKTDSPDHIGLGLFMSYDIITNVFRGNLDVGSDEQGFTVFTITLPRTRD